MDTISAPDDTTLVIKTKNPAPIDLIASSQYGAYMFSPKAAAAGTDWFNQGNAAGTGPYTVRQWAKGQQVVLEKNADYWGGWTDKNFDRVILRIVTENATQVQMLKSGEADFISLVPADAVEQLNKEEGITARGIPSWKNSQFLINVKKTPTDNKDFRRALAHLWDYKAVVDGIYAGHAVPGRGPIPATMWGHSDTIQTPEFSIEKAKTLVEGSGVAPADRKVTMAYIGTSEEYKNSALLFQANAAKAGITVELLPGEWGAIWSNAKKLETAAEPAVHDLVADLSDAERLADRTVPHRGRTRSSTCRTIPTRSSTRRWTRRSNWKRPTGRRRSSSTAWRRRC